MEENKNTTNTRKGGDGVGGGEMVNLKGGLMGKPVMKRIDVKYKEY